MAQHIWGRSLACLAVIGLLGEASAQALASNKTEVTLREVTVTAAKIGATNLQKTPLAITVYTSSQLNQNLDLNITDIASSTPSMQVSAVGPNAVIAIRGIGSNNVYAGSDPDVTMQIDGVYIGRPFAQYADFLDVKRVEVLRGPQGTLYGRNAVGGTINVITRTPTDTFAAQEVFTAGNYGLLQEQGYVSGPLRPGSMQGSLAVDYTYHNNYEQNIVSGAQSGVYDANHGGLRGQVRYEPSDAVVLTTRADWSYLNENAQSYDHLVVPYPADTLGATIIGDYSRVAINSPQYLYQHDGGVSETVDVAISDQLRLKSISAYRQNSYSFVDDSDDTPLTINFARQVETERQITQEIDMNGRYRRFTGVGGFFLLYESEDAFVNVVVPPSLVETATVPNVWTRSGAVFAQGTYDLTPQLKLTVGGRYTRESKSFRGSFQSYFLAADLSRLSSRPGFPINFYTSPDFDAFTPKIGLQWQATPSAMLYVSATSGYKSGGENFAATSLANSTFAPEHIWAYEVGGKTEWFDDRLRLNLDGFYYDYRDLQVQIGISAGNSTIRNAATATDKGLEAEIAAQVTPAFQLNGELSWLDARYSKFPGATVPSGLIGILMDSPRYDPVTKTYDASGDYLNYAPKFSGSFGGQYNWHLKASGELFVRADASYQSREYFDPSNAPVLTQGAYGVVNGFLGFKSSSGSWMFELWGKNLTNRQYLIAMVANSVEPSGVAAAPRTYGLRVSKQW